MPYEVLARKWRPQLFQDVVGQEHITQTLINAIKTDRLAHAYLFGGPRGVGKTSVARILAKAINCEQGEPGVPCNKCRSCVEITEGSSVDVQEIDGASNRGIEEVRELRENIKYMPASSLNRVYIIDEVHMLTLHAFNALLKTLEEPPAHVKFIFATTESNKVPVTILSRCQRFDFKRIPLVKIVSHLEKIAEKEHIKISNSSLYLIAREAEGGMRDAESLMDQVVSFTGQDVEDRHVTEVLGILDRDIIYEASRSIIEGSPVKCLEIVDKIYNYGYDIKAFYRVLMGQFRNLLISVIAPQNHMLDMNESERDELIKQAEVAGSEKLQLLLNFLISREESLRFSPHPRLILEAVMIKLCRFDDILSFEELLTKIESLEKRLVAPIIEGPETSHISDPGTGWALEDSDKIRIEEKRAAGGQKSWDDFLKYLASKNIGMSSILKGWQLLSLTEDTLEIAGGNRSFSAGFFEDKERYDQLSHYCRDFFERNIRINIVVNNKSPSPKELPSDVNPPVVPPTRHSDFSPPVQDILDLFQGEIKSGLPAKEKKAEDSDRPQ